MAIQAGRVPPFALTVSLALVATAAAMGTLFSRAAAHSDLVQSLTFGPDALTERPWAFAAGGLVVRGPVFVLIMATLAVLTLGYYEKRVGALRTAIVFGGTQLIGTIGAAAFVAAVAGTGWPWAAGLVHATDLGPSVGLLGVLAAMTAVLAPDTRRFVRWGVGMLLVILLVQSGLLWDVSHLMGWIVGLAAGPALAGRAMDRSHRPELSVRRIRTGIALLMVTVASARLVTVLFPGHDGIFGPTSVIHTPATPVGALVSLVVVLLIANALRRGLPVAWWASLVFVAIAVGHAVLGTGGVRVADIVSWGVVGLALVAFRTAWPWRVPAGTLRRCLPRLGLALAAFVGLSALLYWIFGDDTPDRPRMQAIFDRATFADGGSLHASKGAAAAFTVSSWIWGLALLFLLIPVVYAHNDSMRGVRRGVGHSECDDALQTLLHRHGGGSIGWQRTWPGFVTWTSADGRVAVSYRPVSGVAIALGDPVGPRELWAQAAREFRTFCFRAGWTPTWYAVTDAFRAEVGEAWQATQIGEDAVLDLGDLEFKGKSWQDVRTARNHAAKAGVRLEVVDLAHAPAALRAQIDEVSKGWVDGKALPEMGFTLGTIDHAADPEMRTHIAIDDAGVVHGVTTWLPVHADGEVVGWTLDVMRRRADGFRPVMEFLIAESALLFQAQGFATMSLSVAPLARRSVAGTRTALDKTLDRMSALLEPAYGFRSLLSFKAKFHPRFAPVYLGYASDLDLAEISLAIGKAYLPHVTARQAIGVARQLVRR